MDKLAYVTSMFCGDLLTYFNDGFPYLYVGSDSFSIVTFIHSFKRNLAFPQPSRSLRSFVR